MIPLIFHRCFLSFETIAPRIGAVGVGGAGGIFYCFNI